MPGESLFICPPTLIPSWPEPVGLRKGLLAQELTDPLFGLGQLQKNHIAYFGNLNDKT